MSITVGQQLRQRRESRSLSIEQAATATKIRPHYLRALEADELGAMPSMAHARGFIRAYAGYLGLDAEALLAGKDEADGGGPPAAVRPATPAAGTRPAGSGSAPPAAVELPAAVGTAAPAAATPAWDDGSPAAAIFAELGGRLKRQRELLGLSLGDVERHTHLRERYLTALEAGNLEGLPSPVQGRGMLNNYAAFLGMNPEPLLLLFADGLQARLAARQAALKPVKEAAQKKKPPALPRRLRRLVSGDVLIGGVLTVFLGLFVFWVAIRIFAITSEQTATPTAPSIAEVLLATATATAKPTAELQTPTPFARSSPTAQEAATESPATDAETGLQITVNPAAGGVQVYVNVRQRAWMRVIVDGKVEFEGRVIPGSAYPFTGDQLVEVTTSSGSAIQILLNGVDQGALGGFGEIVNRLYSAEGVVTPTPTITPTPAPTKPSTPTPRISATPG